MSKKCRFRGQFDKQHGRRAQAFFKSALKILYQVHWSLPSQLSSRNSLWLICQFVGLIVKTLAADKRYPVLNRGNLTRPIQMQLSQKQKTFCKAFAAFLKSKLNFEIFESKNNHHRFWVFEVTDSEKVVS